MQIQPLNMQDAYYLLHEGALALGRMEQQGMHVDVEYCQREVARLTDRIQRLEVSLLKTNFVLRWQHYFGPKFNLHSDFQLSKMLYDVKKMKPAKLTLSGRGSVDEEALTMLGMPELSDLITVGKLKKLKKTYLEAFLREQVDGIIHTSLNLNLVSTFRSSSSSPNLQNVPKRDEEAMQICRRAIIPRPGHQLMEADCSSIEVRVGACMHKDPTMLKYINDPKSDMHGDMAKQIYMIADFDRKLPAHKYLRDSAKGGFVFPQFYGDYYGNCAVNMACDWGKLPRSGKWKTGQGVPVSDAVNLADHLQDKGIYSLNDFTEHIKKIEDDFWGRRFRVYQQWKDRTYRQYQKRGYLDMLTGFRVSGVLTRNEVINTPVQGSAFHCLLWAIIEIDKIFQQEKLKSHMVMEIHDALLIDTEPAEQEHVSEIIQYISCEELPKAWPWIIVPLEIEIETCPVDASWSEKGK